jgi:hypothetical protein
MASKFSGSNFLELATEFDTWRFFWRQHFWSQSSPCKARRKSVFEQIKMIKL